MMTAALKASNLPGLTPVIERRGLRATVRDKAGIF